MGATINKKTAINSKESPLIEQPINKISCYRINKYKNSSAEINRVGKMHGAKRVLAFCLLTAILPSILIVTPLYLRHSIFADVTYPVAESDVVAIVDGVSSIFCEKHSLKMNTTFNAFQLKSKPIPSKKLKHIRLKKSMTLPDDTLEYWGFFLSSGAIVKLKVCSRFDGSRILVVRGEKNLRTCGLLEHNFKKYGAKMDQEHNRVKVTFENHAEELGVIDHFVDRNTASEDLTDDRIELFKNEKQKKLADLKAESLVVENVSDGAESPKKRHLKQKVLEKQRELRELEELLNEDESVVRKVREISPLDAHIEHGGNNANVPDKASSISSFETDLLTCYDGQILLSKGFPPSHLCTDVHYLDSNLSSMHTLHEVASNGYYYYIFYSDNDDIKNDIHAIFDIYKPTYRYANLSKGDDCINQTECSFPISFLRDETVVVEVPTRDGIEHEEDDITLLVSHCHPRTSVYMIFPLSVLLLILGCAFL